MGDTFNHLGFTLAMLPDMLLGVLTGKTKSIGLNQQTMVPLASLLAGTFASNPLMKFPLMLYGGASLFNTAGQEALAEQRKNQSNATRFKRYDDEPLDKRLCNPQIEGNVLLVDIDRVPRIVTLPVKVVEAYQLWLCHSTPLPTVYWRRWMRRPWATDRPSGVLPTAMSKARSAVRRVASDNEDSELFPYIFSPIHDMIQWQKK